MADTQVLVRRIVADTSAADAPARWQLTEAAVRRLKKVTGISQIDDLGAHLGFPRMTFWRLRNGQYDIRISEAQLLARIAGWPLSRMFEEVTGDA